MASIVTQDDDEDLRMMKTTPTLAQNLSVCVACNAPLNETSALCQSCKSAMSEDLPVGDAIVVRSESIKKQPITLSADTGTPSVSILVMKSPSRLIREKFLNACENGQVIELHLSQDEGSPEPEIVDVKSTASASNQQPVVPPQEGGLISNPQGESPLQRTPPISAGASRQDSSPECEIVAVKSAADNIAELFREAEREGRVETLTLSQSQDESPEQTVNNRYLTPKKTPKQVINPYRTRPRTTPEQQPVADPYRTPQKTPERGTIVNPYLPLTRTPMSSSETRYQAPPSVSVDCKGTVEESWQKRCRQCFASPSLTAPGQCRSCSAMTQGEWQQYCGACYATKQQSPTQCIDCRSIMTGIWMKRCPSCFAKISAKKPRMDEKWRQHDPTPS